MNEIPAIRSVMSSLPLSIAIDETVRAAEELMIENEIRHLPVTDAGKLVGIVSDRDIAFGANSPDPGLPDRLRVRDVCTLDSYSVTPDEPLDVVLAEMARRRIGSVVITDGGKVTGLFTATDACRCFAEHLRSAG